MWPSSPECTMVSRVLSHSPLSHVNRSLISAALIDNHGNSGRPNEAEVQVKIYQSHSSATAHLEMHKHARTRAGPLHENTPECKQCTEPQRCTEELFLQWALCFNKSFDRCKILTSGLVAQEIAKPEATSRLNARLMQAFSLSLYLSLF